MSMCVCTCVCIFEYVHEHVCVCVCVFAWCVCLCVRVSMCVYLRGACVHVSHHSRNPPRRVTLTDASRVKFLHLFPELDGNSTFGSSFPISSIFRSFPATLITPTLIPRPFVIYFGRRLVHSEKVERISGGPGRDRYRELPRAGITIQPPPTNPSPLLDPSRWRIP